ncbi:hypothetical protein [Variovorax sp. OV329]|uniref:hypothetical protein n=1 Tax=Variovorax sp. OV329 TaxID=1882825 RepID=UPI0008F17C15|nr:hypothetical protein [Variovorax sp. OV329]SFN12497.1 hypothetical protein SAMN05444747_115135 [Variovorax sp. OV329]
MPISWKRRVILFIQRFWQPTSACVSCMPGSLGNLLSIPHWQLALQTGLLTGILALVLSFTPASRLFSNRYGNAMVVGALTAIGDAFSHPGHFSIPGLEAVLTGIVSGVLALAGSFVFEDRARRLRALWSRLRGRHPQHR